MSKPHPGSMERPPASQRTVGLPEDGSQLMKTLEWMREKDHGVTTRDAVREGLANDVGHAGTLLGDLYRSTHLVDRHEFRKQTGDQNRNVAHLYWLTAAGEAAMSARERYGDDRQ